MYLRKPAPENRRVLMTGVMVAALFAASCGGGGGGAGVGFQSKGAGTGFPAGPGLSFGDGINGGLGSGGGLGGGGGTGGGASGDGPTPNPDPTIIITNDIIQGSVLNGSSGAGISGAAVSFDAVNLTTNSQGDFSQATHPASPRLVIRTEVAGFEVMHRVTTVIDGVPTYSLFKLTPHGTTGTVDAGASGSVEVANSVARVELEAGDLADGGSAASGNVDVRLTPLPIGTDPYLLSGDYTLGSGVSLEAFAAGVIANSRDLTVAAGESLLVQLPVSTRAGIPPATATAYYFDPTLARWVAGPTATRASTTLPSGANASYYSFEADRFALWMVGQELTGSVVVNGCVEDETGARVANVSVTAEGQNYTGLGYGLTNGSGNFSVPVRSTGSMIVSGRLGARLSNVLATATNGSSVTLPECLTLPSATAATVRLTWGEAPRDLDSYLHVPNEPVIYYGNRGTLLNAPYANLDVDDVTGFGPEVTTIRRPRVGIYRFFVNNYSRTFNPGMTESPARVELNYAGRTVVFTPPGNEGTSLNWHVFDLRIGQNCEMTLYRYSRWRADLPGNPNPAVDAPECTPPTP